MIALGPYVALIDVVFISFLLGSIPWGMLISDIVYGKDIRKQGSGNIGSTNIMRTYGVKAGVACFLLDFGKGFLAGILAKALWADLAAAGLLYGLLGGEASFGDSIGGALLNEPVILGVALLACVCGHVFSPWLGWKGGKGVAVGIGCQFVVIGWEFGLFALGIFFVIAVLTRYVSLASMIASASTVAMTWFKYPGYPAATVLCAIAVIVIIWSHRANIKRLLHGEESKFSVNKKKKSYR